MASPAFAPQSRDYGEAGIPIDVAQIVSRLTGLTTTDTTPSLMINKAELMPRLMVDATLNSNLWIKDSPNPLNSMRTKVGISFA